MTNKVFMIGNLTKDVDIRTTNNGKSVASISLAVKRNFKNDKGEYDTDFFNVVVYGAQADNCAKYLKKGSKISVVGRLQTRDYEAKDGTKRYVTEIVTEEVEFLSQPTTTTKGNDLKAKLEQASMKDTNTELVEIEDDDSLPF